MSEGKIGYWLDPLTLNPRSVTSSSQIAIRSAVSPLLPDYDTIRGNIQNNWLNLTLHEILPASASELAIPNEYQMTESGDRFLFFDDSHIYFDGTFKAIPNIFYQMFSIHGSKNDSIVPYAYILMVGKI
ncbi:hypothetical protein RF11_02637 [Thelohanellus kitauei]|uniref:Uncharacterized protein n=1 Tax=Thelohanellus kitauei TaxID=669202 RepID=A0A0C2I5A8_THEKT|nr:hypothetical protein RF11_02637 [Thelohanellus kitauei]